MPRPTKLLISSFVTLLACALTSAACTSQEPPPAKADTPALTTDKTNANAEPSEQLPDGAELLAAHVEAAGGADKIAQFETLYAEGTIDTGEQKLRGSTQMWWQKDGKFYLEQNIEGVGKSRSGYDGETIWLDDPITGLRILEGEEAVSYVQSSLMFPGHDWKQHFSAATTLRRQVNGDLEVWEVELVSKGGPNLVIGLDVNTKRIRYMTTTQVTPMGPLPIEAHAEDYEPVNGYSFAMKKRSLIKRPGSNKALIELTEETTKFEVNVPIDPSMFAFPSKREQVPADPAKQAPIQAPPAAG